MHYHYVNDESGDLCDTIAFCCDPCHRAYMDAHPDLGEYQGWNGCHEGGDSPEFCANCGVFAGGTPECDCQRDNVLVGRFASEAGEKCIHGHWMQLPWGMLD